MSSPSSDLKRSSSHSGSALNSELPSTAAAVGTTPNKASPAIGETPAGMDASAILKGKKLAVVFGAMLLSILLIALDQTILATALPKIASDFGAFSQQGWVSRC